MIKWSTSREYRFNILPYKLAAALTVSVCASADLRSGAGSVVTWAEGVWLQSHDGTAVLVDTQQAAHTIVVKTIEVVSHCTLAPNERAASATFRGGEASNVEVESTKEDNRTDGGSQEGVKPTLRWVSKMQSEMETLVARFPGTSVEVWVKCPQPGCHEHLPFQRILGGGGTRWENMSAVWDDCVWGRGQCGAAPDGMVATACAMCGHVPDAHSFPLNIWVLGSVAKASSIRNSAASGTGRRDLPANILSPLAGVSRAATEGMSATELAENVVIGGDRAFSLRPWSFAENSGYGISEVQQHGLDLLLTTSGTHEEHHHGEMVHMHEWHEEGAEMATETAINVRMLSEYMSDPLNPGHLAVENNLVLEAITACCVGDAREAESVKMMAGSILQEVEEWAPVCRAVFGVLGACLVASGRGKANQVERQRFYSRMVSLGRTLMQVRETFAHNPPPQMEGLLVTLKSALEWIETFDDRGWFMRALKSSADKEALASFHHALTAHCADMSISLQATAHKDEHRMLRDMTGVLLHEMHSVSHKVQHVAMLQHSRVRVEHEAERSAEPYSADRTALLEKKIEELQQEQAAQTQLLLQFFQRGQIAEGGQRVEKYGLHVSLKECGKGEEEATTPSASVSSVPAARAGGSKRYEGSGEEFAGEIEGAEETLPNPMPPSRMKKMAEGEQKGEDEKRGAVVENAMHGNASAFISDTLPNPLSPQMSPLPPHPLVNLPKQEFSLLSIPSSEMQARGAGGDECDACVRASPKPRSLVRSAQPREPYHEDPL